MADLQKTAATHSGDCLSTEYFGCSKHYEWRCQYGHIWSGKFSNILNGQWCPKCSYEKQRKYTIEDLQEIARERGGVCLSEKYVGVSSKYAWQCKNGHRWQTALGNTIYEQSWCPECFNTEVRGKSSLIPAQEISVRLKRKGYELLSPEKYLNTSSDVKVKHVSCGTVFDSSAHRLQKDNAGACPSCNGSFLNSQEGAQKYAEEHGGRLVAWSGLAATKTVWACGEGHEWLTSWSSMRRAGSWCHKCSPKFKKGKQSDLALAKKSCATYHRYDKKKGFGPSDITFEDVLHAKTLPCVYCGRRATGFDRISNSVGHVKSNCVAACVRCNWVRGNYLSYEVMLQVGDLLRRIDP